MSGSFYQQVFELPQGGQISNPSIYVVIFNQSGEQMRVQMLFDAPFGVQILFDQATFPLAPGGERKVLVSLKVSQDAVPGQYDVTISAEGAPTGQQGVKIATASAQKASLAVTGESATIYARVVSPDGFPIKSQVRLFKLIQDKLNEVAQSETGTLEVRISPGRYRVAAYIASRKLGEEEVQVRSEERKEITLTAKTIYFEQFGIEPNYAPETKQLAFVRVVYTLNNFYQLVSNVEVILKVSRDGQPPEQVSLMSLGRLDLGRTGGSYSYIPADGWKVGNYTLKLELNVEGKLYAESGEETVTVAPPPRALPVLPPLMVWGVAAGLAVTAILAMALLKARRRPVALRYALTISVTPAEGGIVTIDPGPGTDGRYSPGQTVTMMATPSKGYTFAGWSGSLTGVPSPIAITMDGDKSVTATFTAVPPAQ